MPIKLDRTYVVRFLNATANKPLHLGHLRNAVLGEATAASIEALGARAIRHCVVEDTGRFVTEAMAALAEFEESNDLKAVASGFKKPDHFVGWCYGEYRRRNAHEAGAAAAGTEYDVRNDVADELQRKLMAGDVTAGRLRRRVTTMALAGQGATLRRLGMSFDYCDYESAEDELLDEFILAGLAGGPLHWTAAGEVVYRDASGVELRLVNKARLPEESARLLCFLRRLLAGWPAARLTVIVAGAEWKRSMRVYPRLLEGYGVRSSGPYAQAFYGMVTLNGRKMASSEGTGVLVDNLLDEVAGSDGVVRLRDASDGRIGLNEFAGQIVKGLLLSVGRTDRLEFNRARLMDPAANPAWEIAEAWARLTVSGRPTPTVTRAGAPAGLLRDAASRVSFELAVRRAGQLARAICAGVRSESALSEFVTLVYGLSMAPRTSAFSYAGTLSLMSDEASRRLADPVAEPTTPSAPQR